MFPYLPWRSAFLLSSLNVSWHLAQGTQIAPFVMLFIMGRLALYHGVLLMRLKVTFCCALFSFFCLCCPGYAQVAPNYLPLDNLSVYVDGSTVTGSFKLSHPWNNKWPDNRRQFFTSMRLSSTLPISNLIPSGLK